MPTTKRRVARKQFRCCGGPGCRRIQPGDVYLEHTVFPGDDSFEELSRPMRAPECSECAARCGRAHLLEASDA